MTTTVETTVNSTAWTDITPSTHTTLIVQAFNGDVYVKVGTSASPTLTDPGIRVAALEKIDLTNRIGVSDYVHCKGVNGKAVIRYVTA